MHSLKNTLLIGASLAGLLAVGVLTPLFFPFYFCQEGMLLIGWKIGALLLTAALVGLLGLVLPKQLLLPLKQIQASADGLANGKIAANAVLPVDNELAALMNSLSRTSDRLQKASAFAQEMGEGKLTTDFQPASQEDALGHVLLKMREQMAQVSRENEQRNWTNEGLAKFAGLLRSGNEIKGLAEGVVGELVRYLKACQAGIFMLNDSHADDAHLELMACYAYERKKYLRKRVELGEGLLGQAYLERDALFLTEVPNEYLTITSGLGGANPKCILIVPLLANNYVEGVLELASFQPFEPHEIAFVEKLAQNMATVFANVKITERTRHLLNESQEQAEKLRMQEEAMRQNLEEMTTIGEEMARKQIELTGHIDALNNAAIVSEVDLRGNIIFANDEFCRISQYSRSELMGKKQSIVRHPDMPAAAFDDMWATITKGIVWKGEVKNRKKDGSHYWVAATITPVLGENGKPIKYIGVRFDITTIKDQEEKALQLANQVSMHVT